MKKFKIAPLPVFILVGVVVAVFLLMIKVTPPNNFLELNFYDDDRNLLSSKEVSIVGGLEGVKFISFKINIKNTDTEDLSTVMAGLTPLSIDQFKSQGELILQPGERGSLETDLIEVSEFEGNLQGYCITIISDSPSKLRDPQTRTTCLSIDIQPESQNQEVGEDEIISDIDPQNEEINLGCEESWDCSVWGECVNELEIRTCVDLNECETFDNKPTTEQFCQLPFFTTTALNGDYRDRDSTINLGEITYTYGGYSAFSCNSLSATVIVITPEGYPVCTRDGYDVSNRVYLDDGRGNIFRT